MASKPGKDQKRAAKLRARKEKAARRAAEAVDDPYKMFGKMQLPASIALGPSDVRVQVAAYTVPKAGALWSFSTEGMAESDQPEVAFMLRRREGEPESHFPIQVLHWVNDLVTDAEKSKEKNQLGDLQRLLSGWFTETGFAALVFVEPEPMREFFRGPPGVFAPLLVLALDAAEMEVSRRFGIYRVLARRGVKEGVHPYPCWWDRDHRPLLPAGADEASGLAKVRCEPLFPAELREQGGKLRLKLRSQAADQVRAVVQSVAPEQSFAILIFPRVSKGERLGWRVWFPGEPEGQVHWPPEKKDAVPVTGAHLLFQVDAAQDRVEAHEDGWALRLRPETWASLRGAILRQSGFAIDAALGGLSFELAWDEPRAGDAGEHAHPS